MEMTVFHNKFLKEKRDSLRFLAKLFNTPTLLHVSCTGQEGVDLINQNVMQMPSLSPLGDKIFILWVSMVTTLCTVVLVWFTNVLAKYVHAIMIAKNIELKQYFNLNSHPFLTEV